MAGLPPDGEWLIQQNDGMVTLFHAFTQNEVVRFDPSDANATAQAQKTIYDLPCLNDEQKCFAYFWCGYFYAYACNFTPNQGGF